MQNKRIDDCAFPLPTEYDWDYDENNKVVYLDVAQDFISYEYSNGYNDALNKVKSIIFEKYWKTKIDIRQLQLEIINLCKECGKKNTNSHHEIEESSHGELGENPVTSPSRTSDALISNDHEGGLREGNNIEDEIKQELHKEYET